jgi:hypothetical protein
MPKKKKKELVYGPMRKKALQSGRTKSGSSHVALKISTASRGGKSPSGEKTDITDIVKALNRTSPKGKVRIAQKKRDTAAYNVVTNKYKEGQ